jgi:hypothetical protein
MAFSPLPSSLNEALKEIKMWREKFTKQKFTPQPKQERVVFPTMLRKMWSGGEVQEWLDENVNKEAT